MKDLYDHLNKEYSVIYIYYIYIFKIISIINLIGKYSNVR